MQITINPNSTTRVPVWMIYYTSKLLCDDLTARERDNLIDALIYKMSSMSSRAYYDVIHDPSQPATIRDYATRQRADAQKDIDDVTHDHTYDPLRIDDSVTILL